MVQHTAPDSAGGGTPLQDDARYELALDLLAGLPADRWTEVSAESLSAGQLRATTILRRRGLLAMRRIFVFVPTEPDLGTLQLSVRQSGEWSPEAEAALVPWLHEQLAPIRPASWRKDRVGPNICGIAIHKLGEVKVRPSEAGEYAQRLVLQGDRQTAIAFMQRRGEFQDRDYVPPACVVEDIERQGIQPDDQPGDSKPTEPAATAQPKSEQRKRKSKLLGNEDNRQLIIGALVEHHKYRDGTVGNGEPATLKQLMELSKIDNKSTVQDHLTQIFGSTGVRQYKAACRSGSLQVVLAGARGEMRRAFGTASSTVLQQVAETPKPGRSFQECAATRCDDPATRMVNGRRYCEECACEIEQAAGS